MWRGLSQISVAVVLVELWLVLAVHTLPLSNGGPNLPWGETIRLRCLYTTRKQDCYYLRIHDDGRVDGERCRIDGERCKRDGERHQRCESLMDIRAVSPGVLAIKNYRSSLYLCMGSDGTLYGTHFYSPEECTFTEDIVNGYNIYKSLKYGLVVSLSKDKQRLQSRGKGYPPLSQFLPRVHCAQFIHNQEDEEEQNRSVDVQSMDPLRLVVSESYHKK